MGGAKKDDAGGKLAANDTEELLKEAAEGLSQVPGSVIPPDTTTVPGIPIDALRLETKARTQKIRRLDVDEDEDARPDEDEPEREEPDDEDELAEADTLPPQDIGDLLGPAPPRRRRLPPHATTVSERPGPRETPSDDTD